ncbi:MAG TPA: SDR family oxidoreductase [Chitinophagaceae bacterium]|nr:SDR family oxidoreductase [Chitinophagaceae bacterium]
MEWKNKVAVITGASTGIGKATKELLRNKGAIVYNLDRNKPGEDDRHFIFCDVSKKENINTAIDTVFEKEKRIDMLFANAGVHLFATLEETTYEQLESIVAINILGIFCLLKKTIPIMKQQQLGSIVLMGSDQTFIGKAGSSVYGMTKAAIGQLAKSTAIDYAPYNIRVNCICPGTINTPLLHRAVEQFVAKTGTAAEEVYRLLDGVQPMGRIGKPEEIAQSVAFLLSDESSFTTGSLFAVDGGYTCQ